MARNVHFFRNYLTGGIVVAGSILAAGCGTHTSAGSGQAASAAPATHGPAAAACSSSNLRISLGSGGAAAGTDFTVLDFTNGGSAPCTLRGFPGVSLSDSAGAQIGAAATRNPVRPSSVVTLAPGAKASAELGVANAENYPTAACKPRSSARLKVFPPNQTVAIEVPFTATGCAASSAHQLSVTAVTAG
jgi:Protein of unknown function (DUF4232)